MRGKTAKKLRKLAKSQAEVIDTSYRTKVHKRHVFSQVLKVFAVEERKEIRLSPECLRYMYQRLKTIWPKKKESLNLIYNGL